MKTAAVFSSLVAVGSLAFAAGQGTVGVPADSSPPPPQLATSGDGGVASSSGNFCHTIGEPLDWFTTVHVLPACTNVLWTGGTSMSYGRWSGDANNDGAPDDLVFMRDFGSGYAHDLNLFFGSNSLSGLKHVLFKADYSLGGNAPSIIMRPVLSEAVLLAVFAALDPVAPWGQMVLKDLADMDRDGDMDCVVWVHMGASAQQRTVWIENTSVANPPLAADLNGDGSVNGVDLAFLLNALTQ